MKIIFIFNCLVNLFLFYKRYEVNCFNLSPQPNHVFKEPNLRSFHFKYESSYFGYSINLRRKSLMVGAPKAQSDLHYQQSNNQTGAIYKCDLQMNSCVPYVMDEFGNVDDKNDFSYTSLIKDNQWLGAVMDGQNSEKNLFVVCAPNVITPNNYPLSYMFHGICYKTSRTSESESVVLLKLTDLRKKDQQYKEKVPLYMYGQQGFSLHVTDNSEEILMGAPGVLNWTGSVVHYKQNKNNNHIYDVDPIIPRPIDSNSYFGYAVTSMIIGDELYYVASAPRGNNLKGEVVIFEFEKYDDKSAEKKINNLKSFSGTQVGEYFGYALLTDDFNSDGKIDLVISAPMYSKDFSFDNGIVYLYLNERYKRFSEKKVLFSTNELNGRFGTSLGKIGDIDLDGYNDLAVGAPFEGNGVVYIFMGSKDGLLTKPSQRIEAALQPPLLYGGSHMFGMSISRGVDIDGNYFNDIAIGSPNAELAYIYKSYPVIGIISVIKPFSPIIGVNDKTFTFQVCWRYASKSKLPHAGLTLRLNIQLDAEFGRTKFSHSNSKQDISVVAVHDTTQCKEHEVIIENYSLNAMKPITIEMTYDLEKQIPNNSTFCQGCAIINPSDSRSVTESVIYSEGCKSKICEPDLVIQSSFVDSILRQRKSYNISSSRLSSIMIDYEIKNFGEKAYNPYINVTISKMHRFFHVPSNCELKQNYLKCRLEGGNALSAGGISKIRVAVNTLDLCGNEFVILAKAFSSGRELNETNNIVEDRVLLDEHSSIEIQGQSSPSTITVEQMTSIHNITHHLQIKNVGPCTIQHIKIYFFMPLTYYAVTHQKLELFEFKNIVVEGNYNNVALNITLESNTISEYKNSDTLNQYDANFKNIPLNRSILFDCEHENVHSCVRGSIDVQDFKTRFKTSPININITFGIDLSQVDNLYTDKDDIFIFITSLEAINGNSVGNKLNIINFNPYTVFTKKVQVQKQIWLYILSSSLSGLLLIMLISYGLFKINFFHRGVKEELEIAKIQAEIKKLEINDAFNLQ